MRGKNAYFTSTMRIPARLTSDIQSVKQKMDYYPCIKHVGGSPSALKYLIDSEYPERFYTIEVERASITLSLHASSSPSYFIAEALLRAANILTILSEDYESDLRCLLPYLQLILRGNDPIADHRTEKPFNRAADVILSRRIVELSRQNKKASAELLQARSSLSSVIAAFILYKYRNGADAGRISEELGVGREEVSASLARLRDMGYKAVANKSGSLDLVRA